MTTTGREVPTSNFGRDWRLCEGKKEMQSCWKGKNKEDESGTKERECERERESGGRAENSIGRNVCEKRKETVDQTSRASKASVWNEDVSISRQIEQHALLALFIFIITSGPYRFPAPLVGLSYDCVYRVKNNIKSYITQFMYLLMHSKNLTCQRCAFYNSCYYNSQYNF